jgi:NACalpha-BTF3-like transcription factor
MSNMTIDQLYREKALNNPKRQFFEGKSEEEVNSILSFAREMQAREMQEKPQPTLGSRLGAGLQTAANIFGQMGGLKTPETSGGINDMIMRAIIDREIKRSSPEGILAQMEYDEIMRKKGATPVEATIISNESSISAVPTNVASKAPPMFIEKPKGKDKYGIMQYETIENPEYKIWADKQKDIGVVPTSEAGRVALAEESLKNIDDVIGILFPSGRAKSYKRLIAAGSNIPLSGLPLIPSNIGFKNPQDVFRKMGAALSGRQLIQTGVAARPEETLKLVRQFAPSGLMSSESALQGLRELKDFYSNYLRIVKTRGQIAADEWAKQQNKTTSSDKNSITEEDIQYTMKKHNLSREEVLRRIGR